MKNVGFVTRPPIEITVVADLPCKLGEAPLWHPDLRCVVWSDIEAGNLYRFDPDHGRTERVYQGRPVGGMTLQADGSLLLFRDAGNIVRLHLNGAETTVVSEVAALAATRFNDVCADSRGRVYCGTLSTPDQSGRLYRLDCEGRLTLLHEGYGTPNGMGFAADGSAMYFNDSRLARTWRFAYDGVRDTLSAPTLWRDARARNDPGRPDGMALDAEGGVWTGRWDGGCVLCVDSRSERITQQIDLPARNVSSLCFAGPDLEQVYVTSAGGQGRPETGTHAGALFRIRGVGVRGLPRHRSRVRVRGASA